jgi:sec-independent protein translocase protein TatA
MQQGMGFGELLLLLFVVLLFFGAGKLPALGEGLGKAIRGLKDAVKGGPEEPAPPAEEKKGLPPKA